MKNIEPLVKTYLRDYSETRKSDRELMIRIWEQEGLKLDLYQKNCFLTKCSSPETIRRTRQKIQHDGFYLPDEKTQKLRKQKAQEMHDKFAQKTFRVFDPIKEIYIELR